MMEWQTIDSAPRDGSRILAYLDADMYYVIHWECGWWMISGVNDQVYPSFWCALPTPPEAKP